MPNTPLQNFRAVEPANYAFGSSATLASQPFVLHHTATAVANAAVSTSLAEAYAVDRFFPWVSRLKNSHYPVSVPNAYDRILISPMYVVEGASTTPNLKLTGIGTAPIILPMGLAPQTRGTSTNNQLNPKIHRLPEDVLNAAKTSGQFFGNTSAVDSRTNGHWNVLPPYAANFLTNNGVLAVGSSTNPTHFARTGLGVGPGYFLPADLSISTTTANPLALGDARIGQTYFIQGQGIEYATLGSEEIVVCIGTYPVVSHLDPAAATEKIHFLLVGMFLG